ncbi:ATP-dependent RNA helicase RhlB [Litoribrevibacter albus]|uniref:ATP-dependent RNA helicase RhlB n=1 Tax=Litoribrevibacter albus TaxID=1473156 RepID=A0AA37W709_9GAMM|nr:ATP-dependent RNA helicase RhlB [Litoribrevibacter albus]GLQ30101.1 ATP-dependent RNA helicase RhlB [Litoribrevibacter albus]
MLKALKAWTKRSEDKASGKDKSSSKNQSQQQKTKKTGQQESGGSRKPRGNNSKSGNKPHGQANAKSNKRSHNKAKPRDQHEQKHARTSNKSDWSIDQFVVPVEEGKVRFHDFELHSDLMRGICESGFNYCTPIQASAIPIALQHKDITGKAQTGTGKTAAFLISVIQNLLNNPYQGERFASEPRVLALAPTRELALQIEKDARELTRYTDLTVACVVGGMDYDKQRQVLRNSVVDILIGTPGRLIDFMFKEDVYLDQVEILILDEADRMLDMGFIPDVRKIVRQTPHKEDRQTLLFSATYNDDIIRLTEQWTMDPVRIEIEPEQVTSDRVDQRVYLLEASQRYGQLKKIIDGDDVGLVIVFLNRRDQTRRLYEKLKADNVKVAILSGDVPQNKRLKTLENFKKGSIKVLVATDVAGRGIHVDDITHVVNYTLPEDPEDYVHRIGRTGRAGRTGHAISFASEDDAFVIPEIEAYVGDKLKMEYIEN